MHFRTRCQCSDYVPLNIEAVLIQNSSEFGTNAQCTQANDTNAKTNHSVENADVAFVKGANERNESFENTKKNCNV